MVQIKKMEIIAKERKEGEEEKKSKESSHENSKLAIKGPVWYYLILSCPRNETRQASEAADPSHKH